MAVGCGPVNTVTVVVGWCATVAFLSELVPQPVRLLRTRSVAGLSPVGTGVYFVTELGWVAYGLTEGLVVVIVTAVVAVGLSGAQFAMLWRHRAPRDLWWMVGWGTALALSLAFGVIGALLVVGLAVGLGPQAWAAWRAPVADGVSVWRWVLSATSGSLWLAYGVLVGSLPLMATGAVAIVCASLALSRFAAGALRRFRRPGVGPLAGDVH